MDEVKSNADVELERMKYLKNFERQNNVEQIFNEGVSPVGKKIVELLKKRRHDIRQRVCKSPICI